MQTICQIGYASLLFLGWRVLRNLLERAKKKRHILRVLGVIRDQDVDGFESIGVCTGGMNFTLSFIGRGGVEEQASLGDILGGLVGTSFGETSSGPTTGDATSFIAGGEASGCEVGVMGESGVAVTPQPTRSRVSRYRRNMYENPARLTPVSADVDLMIPAYCAVAPPSIISG